MSSEEEKTRPWSAASRRSRPEDLDAMDELLAPDFVDHSLLPGQGTTREDYKRLSPRCKPLSPTSD